jgi:hypothetical protein
LLNIEGDLLASHHQRESNKQSAASLQDGLHHSHGTHTMHLTLTPLIFYFFILGALHLETTLYSSSDALFFMLFCSEFGKMYQVLFTEPFFFGNFQCIKLSENNNKYLVALSNPLESPNKLSKARLNTVIWGELARKNSLVIEHLP